MNLSDLITWLKELIEEFAPAIAVMLWNYEEAKIEEANNKALDAEVKLELEKNHEAVDNKYSGRSDADVVSDAIKSGGQSGQNGETNKPGTTSSGD